jgi:peroxiredoxin
VRKTTFYLIMFVLLLPMVAFGQDEAPKVFKAGDMVSEIKAKTLEGSAVNILDEIKAGKAIITFMNTSCTGCLAEIKAMQKLISMEDKDSVELILISVDMVSDRLNQYMEQNKLAGARVFHDPDFATPAQYGFSYTPGLIVVEKSGKVLLVKGGWNNAYADKYIKTVKDVL